MVETYRRGTVAWKCRQKSPERAGPSSHGREVSYYSKCNKK